VLNTWGESNMKKLNALALSFVVICAIGNVAYAEGLATGEWVNKFFVDFTDHDHQNFVGENVNIYDDRMNQVGADNKWSEQQIAERKKENGVVIGVQGNLKNGVVEVIKTQKIPAGWVEGIPNATAVAGGDGTSVSSATSGNTTTYTVTSNVDGSTIQYKTSGTDKGKMYVPIDGTTITYDTANKVLKAQGMASVEYKNNITGVNSTVNDVSNYNTTEAKGMIVSSVTKETATDGSVKLRATLDNIKVPIGGAKVTNKYATIWVED